MKRYLLPALLLGVFFLAGRFWSELSVHAGGGGAFGGNGDINGDGFINVTDVISLLNWMFQGGDAPVAYADGVVLTSDQLEALSHISMVNLPKGNGETVRTIRISGVNVQIVNGLGATHGIPTEPYPIEIADPVVVNGLGNLIVGYQEERLGHLDPVTRRTGSHNIIVGTANNYTSCGCLIAGFYGNVTAPFASVTGGTSNTASEFSSSVSGGGGNTASGAYSSVSGGSGNTASENSSSVSGGARNTAKGLFSSVSGGCDQTIQTQCSHAP